MMKRLLCLFSIVFLGLFYSNECLSQRYDLIPNENIAIKFAILVWEPLYGDIIFDSEPFNTSVVSDSIWHVFGTPPTCEISTNTEGDTVITMQLGGIPHIYVNRNTCEVIDVYHTK